MTGYHGAHFTKSLTPNNYPGLLDINGGSITWHPITTTDEEWTAYLEEFKNTDKATVHKNNKEALEKAGHVVGYKDTDSGW